MALTHISPEGAEKLQINSLIEDSASGPDVIPNRVLRHQVLTGDCIEVVYATLIHNFSAGASKPHMHPEIILLFDAM